MGLSVAGAIFVVAEGGFMQATVAKTTETETLGTFIRQRRRELGWACYELAVHAGVSPNTVRALERDDARPLVGTLGKLAAALGVPADQLTHRALLEQGR
jgi:transcriptional regulator with XRE-family HTH domain